MADTVNKMTQGLPARLKQFNSKGRPVCLAIVYLLPTCLCTIQPSIYYLSIYYRPPIYYLPVCLLSSVVSLPMFVHPLTL